MKYLVSFLAVSTSLFGMAHWFDIEGPEATCEPYRDHGDGIYICRFEDRDLQGEPTFPEHGWV